MHPKYQYIAFINTILCMLYTTLKMTFKFKIEFMQISVCQVPGTILGSCNNLCKTWIFLYLLSLECTRNSVPPFFVSPGFLNRKQDTNPVLLLFLQWKSTQPQQSAVYKVYQVSTDHFPQHSSGTFQYNIQRINAQLLESCRIYRCSLQGTTGYFMQSCDTCLHKRFVYI